MAESAQNLLTEAERRRMLREITTIALAVGNDLYPENRLTDMDIGEAPETSGDICPRERLGFIASAWPRLASALAHLEGEPPPALRAGTRTVPLERARRIAPKDLLAALRRASPNGFGYPVPAIRVAERIAQPHYDTPANRLVKSVLATFVRDLGTVYDLATVCALPEIAEQAYRLRRAIRAALHRPPWQTLPLDNAPSVSAWASLRTHGPYRLFWDAGRRYRQGFAFDWSNPLFTLPARDTWLLYEYWCLFRTAAALRALGFRVVGSDLFALSRSGLTFRLARGRASRLTFANTAGHCVHLYYTREFVPSRADQPAPNTLYAATHSLRPDITLEADDGRLLVLDAKYKGYSRQEVVREGDGEETVSDRDQEPENLPLTNDINQLHAYRDGIRRGGLSARRPITAGWLLYVGRMTGGNLPVISYPKSTPDALFGRGEVGALLLRPGKESFLPGLLRAFVANDLPFSA